jgi:hypothetical protein
VCRSLIALIDVRDFTPPTKAMGALGHDTALVWNDRCPVTKEEEFNGSGAGGPSSFALRL